MSDDQLIFELFIQGSDKELNTVTQLKRELKAVNDQLKVTGDTESIQKLEKQAAALKGRISDLTKEQRLFSKEIAAADKAAGSYDQIDAKLQRLKAQFKALGEAERNSKVGQNLVKQIQALDEEIKSIDASIGQFQRNVGNYPQTILGAITGAVPGLQSLETGLNSVGDAATGTGKAIARAFVLFEAASLVYQGITAISDLTREMEKLRVTASKLNFDNLDEAVIRTRTLATVFKETDENILAAANTLTNEFDLGTKEAFDLLQAGFINGANASGQLLDNVREYSTQFATAKLSAKDLIDIITIQAKTGIFSDKGPDTIKEVVLRLRELPKATVDALEAIGLSSEQIRKTIAEKGIGAAIAQVSQQLGQFKDDAPEVGQALADIFGGPGEDAGIKFIRTLNTLGDELDNVRDKLDPITQRQLELLEATEDYNAAILELDKSLAGSFGDLDVFTIKVKTFGIQIADVAAKALVGWQAIFNGYVAYLTGVRLRAQQEYEIIVTRLEILKQQVQKLNPFSDTDSNAADIEIKRLQRRLEGLRNSRVNPFTGALNVAQATVDQAKADAEAYVKARNEAEAAAQAKADKTGNRSGRSSTEIERAKREAAEAKKLVEDKNKAAAKAQEEEEKALEKSYEERRKFIALERALEKELEEDRLVLKVRGVQRGIEAIERGERIYLAKLQEQRAKGLISEKEYNTEVIELRLRSARELQKRLQQLAAEQKSQGQTSTALDTEARIAELEAKIAELEAALAAALSGKGKGGPSIGGLSFEEFITGITNAQASSLSLIASIVDASAEARLSMYNAEIEKQEELIQTTKERIESVTGFERLALEKQLSEQIEGAKRLEAEKLQAEREARRRRKAFAVAQATIDAASAGIVLWTDPSLPYLGKLLASFALAAKLAESIAKIKAQEFATGGMVQPAPSFSGERITGASNIPLKANGDSILATLRPGEVVLNEQQQAALGGAQTFRAIGVPGFATGGMVAAKAPTIGLSAQSILSAAEAMEILKQLKEARVTLYTDDLSRATERGARIEVKTTL